MLRKRNDTFFELIFCFNRFQKIQKDTKKYLYNFHLFQIAPKYAPIYALCQWCVFATHLFEALQSQQEIGWRSNFFTVTSLNISPANQLFVISVTSRDVLQKCTFMCIRVLRGSLNLF